MSVNRVPPYTQQNDRQLPEKQASGEWRMTGACSDCNKKKGRMPGLHFLDGFPS